MLPACSITGRFLGAGALGLLLTGCGSPSHLPSGLDSQIDHTLAFVQLKEHPDTYRGKIVMFGGEVLAAKRLKDGTRIEVLQLPLEGGEPIYDRTKSTGRFVAIQRDFLDPATLPYGTRVSIVGEVIGVLTLPLDETEYQHPMLEVKSLAVFPDRISRAPIGPYIGPYYYFGPYGPYWGRGYWYGPYWW